MLTYIIVFDIFFETACIGSFFMNNAVAVMRISSDRQKFEGDSIEHQKDQIDRYAELRSIRIKKYFIFIESASKEQQPVQEAIDYCKNPKNNIQLFIIKSIDRFTRGGSSLYDHMKTELTKRNVKLVDLYGVINNQEVNTLEHLGVKYSWSVYNPGKKSELLEAERGKDELRDIMSRMIGAEIRYVRLGYHVRKAPYGYENKKVETVHGKRVILVPHPTESVFIKSMYRLKEQGLYNDQEIVDQLNSMGFRSRRFYLRNPNNKSQITGVKGDKKLELKHFDRYIQNPIYAAITIEKWTDYKPLKCQFEGLVSIETFNKVNMGKVMIIEEAGELKVLKKNDIKKRMIATKKSLYYPYRRIVLCSIGKHSFFGSASRGRLGKHYPAYHCDKSKRGHYIRIPLNKFHETIVNYLNDVRIKEEYIDKIQAYFAHDHENKTQNSSGQNGAIKERIFQIDTEITLAVRKIKFLQSEIALRALEEEIENLKNEKDSLMQKQSEIEIQMKNDKSISSDAIQQKSNTLPQFIINDHTAAIKTRLFNMLFEELPTYDDLVNRTAKLKPEFEVV